jgi:hypothetical protein
MSICLSHDWCFGSDRGGLGFMESNVAKCRVSDWTVVGCSLVVWRYSTDCSEKVLADG